MRAVVAAFKKRHVENHLPIDIVTNIQLKLLLQPAISEHAEAFGRCLILTLMFMMMIMVMMTTGIRHQHEERVNLREVGMENKCGQSVRRTRMDGWMDRQTDGRFACDHAEVQDKNNNI